MPRPADDPRYTAAVIPTTVIAGLVDYARARGVPPEPWFSGLGFSAAQSQQPGTLISFRQAANLIRRALRALPAEAIGLQVGSRESLVSFGVVGFAMLTCRTFREAFEIGVKHHQAAGSLMDIAVEVQADEVALRLYERFPEPELLPFLCEEAISSSVVITRAMIGRDFNPRRVEFSYPAPSYAGAYHRLFNCELRFGCDANRSVFDSALLDHPLSTYNPLSFSAALSLCRQQIDMSMGDITASVERLLGENLRERLSMAEIATRLNLSERSLRRQLADTGQSFSAIRDRVLEQRARVLLRDSRLPVSAIGAELGFSDSRDFRRAFRRWTGSAPRSLRRQFGTSTED